MLPNAYLEKMKLLLNDEYDDYINSFNNTVYRGLRINTSKISINDFLSSFPYDLKPIPWTSDGFYYSNDEVTKHPFFYQGLYYIQEPSAMLPAEVLPINQNDYVLDMCAAPGGKSLKLLNKLNNTGLLVSNDISASRASGLLRNIERQGFSNFLVTSVDGNKLLDKYPNTFDKILLDAPCSGEGMFRKDHSLIKSWLEKNNDYYSNIQKELIISAIKLLKDGGQLVYSTCTFDQKEDEEVVEYALNQFPDLKIIPIKMHKGFKYGKNNIGVKLFPHLINGEGHFVCLLQKGETIKSNKQTNEDVKIDIDFFKKINKNFKGRLISINNNLYLSPDFDTNDIRVLRSGLLLGEITKNGFKPSQTLAVSLKKDEFINSINLSYDYAIKYLKGETIKVDSDVNDYILLCHKDYPLGFGKNNNGLIKNLIDKGWIIK